ncbi:MAG: glycosyltransferase family 4 protein [Nitrososphaeraceae archaeon]
MIILFVVSRYRSSGGHENVMDNLALGLHRLGHEVAIGAYCFERPPPDGIPALKLNRSGKIPKFLDSKKDIDIIHNHHGKMNYYSIFSSKPFIFHYHGASDKLQELNLRLSLFLCRKRISKIICVSNFALSHIREVAGSPSFAIPSEVIYNGVDSNFYRTNLPKKYKIGYPQLLFVGNLYKYKNVAKIIEELPQIRKSFQDASFQIVGRGTEYEPLKDLIYRKGFDNFIQLLGAVSDEELRLIYSSCDLYVSASGYEAVGMPLMEAMACGKPLLVSDIPGHKELLSASHGGIMFSLEDRSAIEKGIITVLNHSGELAVNARKFAEENDWYYVCKKISKTYDEIVSN